MAKRLLLKILVDFLGDYIDGLSEENLRLGVWSGKIVMNNLQLNRKTLQNWYLPISVSHGSVKTLQVVIPWATLESNPVKVVLDGVYLQVGPLDAADFDSTELREQAFMMKRHRLDQAEKAVEVSAQMMGPEFGKDKGRNMSYIQRLTAKIVDNIEVTLQNIHIRYEDSKTIPGYTFSAGITLDSFVVTTADENWIERFVARNMVDPTSSINKLATMKNLGFYWNSKEMRAIAQLDFEEWEKVMQSLIYTSSTCQVELGYILAPPNNLTVRIIHTECSDSISNNIPKIDMQVDSTVLTMKLEQSQYSQIMSTANILAALERQKHLYLHRPVTRPTDDPGSWWHYALKLVTKRDDIFAKNSDKIMTCLKARNRYLHLLRRKRLIGNDELNESEKEELRHWEESLPVEALIVFRQLFAKSLVDESRSSTSTRRVTRESSWWGWGWGDSGRSGSVSGSGKMVSHDSEVEDDVSLDALDFGHPVAAFGDSDPSTNDFLARFGLDSSATLNLYVNGVHFAIAKMSLQVSAKVHTRTIFASFSLKDFTVTDVVTPNAVIRDIVTVQRQALSQQFLQPMFLVEFDMRNGKSVVRISALPFELTWNKLCIQKILGMFLYYTPLTRGAPRAAYVVRSESQARLSAANFQGIDVTFEAEAPKLIFPEDSSIERGYVLLDTGYLAVKGYLGPAGMWWDVSLKAINAGMPRRVKEMYLFRQQLLYLIKPYNLTISAQNIVKSTADMTCSIEVDPGIQGELDASKLARLLLCIQIVSNTFLTAMRGEDPAVMRGAAMSPRCVSGTGDTGDTLVQSSATTVQQKGGGDVDPLHRTLDVRLHVPEVALDLQYDVHRRQHLILTVNSLKGHLIMRPYDMQLDFDLNTVAIEDSQRNLSQRDLVRTPVSDRVLVRMTIAWMYSRKSPLFRTDGTEVTIDFAEIALNVDYRTLGHVRPFYEVLLGRREHFPAELQSVQRPTVDVANGRTVSGKDMKDIDATAGGEQGLTAVTAVPRTMHVVCTLGKISLDLLQTAKDSAKMGLSYVPDGPPLLDPMFCLEIAGLSADIVMSQLIRADVQFRSVNILDKRETSREYAFKTIVTPDMLSNINTQQNNSDSKEFNFLSISYVQESRQNSFVDISIKHVTSFVSLDTVLDLVDVSVANAFAVLDLVAPVDIATFMPVLCTIPMTTLIMAESGYNTTDSPVTGQLEASSPPILDPFTISCRIRIPNARMILLEDPTTLASRAIVGRCSSEVTYVREVRGGRTREIHEALHLSMQDFEIFVLLNMQRWLPLQILEPYGLEFHMTRMLERGSVVTVGLSLDTDNIDARVSLNDLALAQAILMRRTLTTASERQPFVTEMQVEVPNIVSGVQLSVYDITAKLGAISLVTVNDFNGQNNPILRLQCLDTSVHADGVAQNLKGEGSSTLSIDFYNIGIASWEPVMERWHATVDLGTHSNGSFVNVISTHTMQCTLSGIMLETLLQTVSLQLRSDGKHVRDDVHDVVLKNQLGVPVSVYDSCSKALLLTLTDDTITPLYASHSDSISDTITRCRQTPILMDLKFEGRLGQERLPLYHLPLNIRTCKAYHLRPALFGSDKVSGKVLGDSLSITEEIYENQRYDPMQSGWVAPFLYQDPHDWTSADGVRLEKSEICLPTDQEWEWETDWAVDADADEEEGWEYGLNFAAFSSNIHRHNLGTLDCVRRRRWVRTRVPKPAPLEDPTRPLTLFWEVATKANGSRSVFIRSGFQIANYTSFPITISLSSSAWTEDYIFGPVEQNSKLCVPLLYAYASGLRVKPNESPYAWSKTVLCGVRTSDYKDTCDIICPGEGVSPVCLRMLLKQINKSVLVTLVPYIIIQNRLPCDISFRCFSIDTSKIEESTLAPGASCKLSHIDHNCQPQLSFKAGTFCWSQPRAIDFVRSDRYDFDLRNTENRPELVLSMRCKRGQAQSTEVCVFSRGVLLDRTGLGLSVRGLCSNSAHVITRRTWSDERARGTDEGSFKTAAAPDEEVVGGGLSSCASVVLDRLRLKSRRRYLLTTGDLGDLVYTDRDLRWTQLPSKLRKRAYLSPPCDDRSVRTSALIQFVTNRTAVVFVLYDIRNNAPPPWLVTDGFRRISEQAIARRVVNGRVQETHYVGWGKHFNAGESVSLGANILKDSRSMYVVFVVGSSCARQTAELLEQIPMDCSLQHEAMQATWLYGGNGLTMFYTDSNKISIGAVRGTAWCEQVNTKLLSSSKGLFEILDKRSKKGYQLAYSVSYMPGIFRRTQVVAIMPRFCIVNCMDEPIEIRQTSTLETLFVEPFHAEGWHKNDATRNTLVQLRSQSSMWSFGSVDVNEVGTSVLLLPSAERQTLLRSSHHSLMVAHIEVKLAELTENCAVVVVIWRATIETGASLSVRNDTDVPIVLQQADAYQKQSSSQTDFSMFEVCVAPGSWVPFGWIDPQAPPNVVVGVGQTLATVGKRYATIGLMKVGQQLRLPDGASRQGEVVLAVQTSGSGRMLRIVRKFEELSVGDAVKRRGAPMSELSVSFSLASVGLSLVVEKPVRREFLSIYLEGIWGRLASKGTSRSLEFIMRDFQVDNYSETCVYPVMLHGARDPRHDRGSQNDTPIIQVAIIQDTPMGTVSVQHYRYIAIRILEIDIAIDSATLWLLLSDLIMDLEFVSHDQALATKLPERWIQEFNNRLLSSEEQSRMVDVYKSQMVAQASKMYFQELIIHPIKITLTFVQTPFPRKKDSDTVTMYAALLELVTSIASVDKMVIKLNSFIVSEALESADSLSARILSKTWRDLQFQLAQMAGSLTFLGSPVGLARNIGLGVQDFFYEPYQGLVQSPQDFVIGIGRGTSSLVAGVVSGALNSTAAIVGTASKGIALLSGDLDFVRARALQQQRNQASRGGVLAGAQEGVVSVYSGFASGIAGLFTKPIDEARRDGPLGFLRGIGLGIIGAAVKPVLGVTDGITSVAQGISNQVGDVPVRIQARPPRAFDRSDADVEDLRLIPIDIPAAYAQEFVLKRAREKGYYDSFLCRVPLTSYDAQAAILSETYLYWRRETGKLWGRCWGDVSHCLYLNEGVELVLYGAGQRQGLLIKCQDRHHSILLYTALARNAHRMGNPAMVLPVEVATQTDTDSTITRADRISSRLGMSAGPSGELDGYKFGTANRARMSSVVYGEKEVLTRAEIRLSKLFDSWARLDEAVWQLVWEWELAHRGLGASRCCATVVINGSDSPVQVSKVQILEGRGVSVYCCAHHYDEASRSLRPQGAVVFFGWAYAPSPMDVGHIRVCLNTSAFTATMSSRKRETKCEGVGGFATGFLEKTLERWWSKNVILVT